MIRFNRELLERGLAQGDPISQYANRAVGKTTGALLAAIGHSYGHPGEPVEVQDPDQDTGATRYFLVRAGLDLLDRLDFQNITFVLKDVPVTPGKLRPRVFVINTFSEGIQ